MPAPGKGTVGLVASGGIRVTTLGEDDHGFVACLPRCAVFARFAH